MGRMGANMVRRLMRAGHDCVVYDVSPGAVAGSRVREAPAPARWRSSSRPGVPALHLHHGPGAFVDDTIAKLAPLLEADDTIVDAATRTTRRLAARGGTRRAGASLRRHGHERRGLRPRARLLPDDRRRRQAVERLDPFFSALAPASTRAARTPGARASRAAEQGYLHCGPPARGTS
jgi:6-phosphogluconate dehydrogenase